MSRVFVRRISASNVEAFAMHDWLSPIGPARVSTFMRVNGILMALIMCLLPLVLCGCDSDPTVATVEQTSDQAQLARIAVEAKDISVRRAAFGKLTDQNQLGKIAIEGKISSRSLAAVEKLTDQEALAKIAIEAWNSDIRRAAFGKLTDQSLLGKIAIGGEDRDVRRVAVEKLTDQEVLEKIAIKAWDSDVRRVAFGKLTEEAALARVGSWAKPELTRQVTDQALLAQIAIEARDRDVRRAAMERLDQGALGRIAIEAKDWQDRLDAVGPLTDQSLLGKIAIEDKDSNVRRVAIGNLTDQEVLEKIATKEKLLDNRLAAIARLKDSPLLRQLAEKATEAVIRQTAVKDIADDGFLLARLPAESSVAVRDAIVSALHGNESLRLVAKTAYYREDRAAALRRLQDPPPDVVAAQAELSSQVTALAGETDNGKLRGLALEGAFDVLRATAAQRLDDPAEVEEVARLSNVQEVLSIVLAKLEDKAVLDRIASAADNPAMRLAAAHKSGAKSWVQIFDAATGYWATAQTLDDALAAVALFSKFELHGKFLMDTLAGVDKAALNLIRRGDESRIPEMVDRLEGDWGRTFAEYYLNCGQPDLVAAAELWASRKGFVVRRDLIGAGSHRATWGQ